MRCHAGAAGVMTTAPAHQQDNFLRSAMLKLPFNAITGEAAPAAPPPAHRASHARCAVLDRRRAIQAAAAFAALPLIAPRHAVASAVDQISRDYDTYAASYDDLDGGVLAEALGFPDQRAALLARAHGGRTAATGAAPGLPNPCLTFCTPTSNALASSGSKGKSSGKSSTITGSSEALCCAVGMSKLPTCPATS